MSLPFSYRAVGVYGYFPFLSEDNCSAGPLIDSPLPQLTSKDRILTILGVAQRLINSYSPPITAQRNNLIFGISNGTTAFIGYNYNRASCKPPNSKSPTNTYRFIRTKVDLTGNNLSQIIQYYRSVTVENNSGQRFTIQLPSVGQPKIRTTLFNQNIAGIDNLEEFLSDADLTPLSYNLTQRVVLVDLRKSPAREFYAEISKKVDENLQLLTDISLSDQNQQPLASFSASDEVGLSASHAGWIDLDAVT